MVARGDGARSTAHYAPLSSIDQEESKNNMIHRSRLRLGSAVLAVVTVLAAGSASAEALRPHATVSQKNAIQSAENYLNAEAFSKQGLIQQLSSSAGSGFSRSVATYAVDHLHVNWNKEAIKATQNYLNTTAFSKQGLIQQLSSSGGSQFTEAQAVYAVSQVHVNWNTEAVKAAKNYLNAESFSCQGLIQQLSSSAGSQFTEAQAKYAGKKVGLC